MILSLLLLQAGSFTFPGGGDAELVAAIGAKLKQPVAILAAPERKWPKASIVYTDQADLRRDLASRFGLRYAGPATGVLEAPWPRAFFYKQDMQFYQGRFRPAKALFQKGRDGAVSLSTPEGAVSLVSLRALRLSKPLSWHWYYDGAYVAASIRKVSEATMVNSIAEALGAKLVVTKAGYSFDFDPTALKRRMSRFGAEARSNRERADDAYVRLLIRSLSNEFLTRLYQDRSNSAEVEIVPGGDLAVATRDRVNAQFAPPESGTEHPSMTAARRNVQASVDWSVPPVAVVRADGTPLAKFKAKEKNAWFML